MTRILGTPGLNAPVLSARHTHKAASSTTGTPVFSASPAKSAFAPLRAFVLPLLLASPLASLPSPAKAQESPATIQQTTDPAAPALAQLEKQVKANETTISELESLLAQQKKQMETFNTVLGKIQQAMPYDAFVKLKQEAIQKAQAAQFLVNTIETRVETRTEGNTTFQTTIHSIVRSESGWVGKDSDGKLFMITAYNAVKDTALKDPKAQFEIDFKGVRFKTTLAVNLPGDVKPGSQAFDIALLELPQDAETVAKLKEVALPLSNYLGRQIPAGTEALSIAPHFETMRYVTEGIVSDHDLTGARKHKGQHEQFPLIWTDAAANEGGFGAPLLGFNWESKTWDVIGMTCSRRNDLMNAASPTDVIQAFLSKRGFNTVEAGNPKQVEAVESYHKRDLATAHAPNPPKAKEGAKK